MAALAHFPHITLHATHSVYDPNDHGLPSHDPAVNSQNMEQTDEEGGGDTAHSPHTSQPTDNHTTAHAAALTAPPLAPGHMDSDMEGGEDTAGGVSPSPWPQLTNADTASVHAADLHDPPDVIAPPLFAPQTPVPPPPPPPHPPQLDGPEHAFYPPPPPPAPMDRPHVHDRDEEEDVDDDDDDDDERSHVSYDRARNFYPFEQDTSVPDAEELRILQSYTERSAVDDAHWREKTFFDPQDPDLVPGDSGTIDWVVTEFNGTKENPRKDLLLRSPSVRIGGHDWRIKLLPHGNVHTDRLSLYVENVTVQSLPPEEWPEDELPLPVVGETKVMKRKAVAAQISIVVYNPDEPRVNEFKSDAHQFHQDSPDHGWPRFSSVPWYEIHRRSYAQRQPLLRNDTLAIRAFVRVIHDPTGCMWTLNESEKLCESASMTGLSSFPSFDNLAIGPVLAMWLHLRPFRELIYALGDLSDKVNVDDDSFDVLCLMQSVLYRMRSRKVAGHISTDMISDYIECAFAAQESHDIVQTMDHLLFEIDERLHELTNKKDFPADAAQAALEQLGRVFGNVEAQFSGSRQTKRSIEGKSNIQEVVEGLSGQLGRPEILTIDLERQVFDPDNRCWKKLLNKICLDDRVVVGDDAYTLYAFATHEGHLQNGRYASFFRPAGLGGLWYTYKQGYASCQTRTKTVLSKEGVTPPEALEEPVGTHNSSLSYDRLLGRADAVAYVVVYVRNDVAGSVFNLSIEEPWNVPQWIVDDHEPKSAEQVQATNGAPVEMLAYDEHASREPVNDDLEMNDAVTDVSNEGKASDGDIEGTSSKVTIDYLSQPFYEGQMKSCDYHGEGHLIYLDGNEYTGSFSAGCREGLGTMIYQNGDEYTGEWKSDQHHGCGTYKEKRTGNVYKGHWEEGKKHGEGTTFWKVSEEESRMCRICYCAEADAAFYDCGHVVACSGCARRVEDCPVCRRMVRDVVKLYYLA